MNKRIASFMVAGVAIGFLGGYLLHTPQRPGNQVTGNTCISDFFAGIQCSGCQTKSPNEACLMHGPEGQITQVMQGDSSGKLMVIGSSGTAEIDMDGGVEKVFKDTFNTGGYYLTIADRAADSPKSFDKVLLVTFANGKPSVSNIINEPGDGYYTNNIWYFVPLSFRSFKDLALKEIDASGATVKEFPFGRKLTARPDFDGSSEVLLTGATEWSAGSLLLSFGKVGLAKGDVYEQFVINPEDGTVQKLILK